VGVKQIKIDVNEVTLGMFVSGLDRPWTQTPFPLQGFYVRDLSEINTLKSHCKFIYIDILKGAKPVKASLRTLEPAAKPLSKRSDAKEKVMDMPPLKPNYNTYPVVATLEQGLIEARELHQQVYTAVIDVMHSLQQDAGAALLETKRAATAMVGSVLRCPDAFTWLTRVKKMDEHLYGHALRCAVWGILLGRHLGMPRLELEMLAMGLLLKDVGKTQIAESLLFKAQRSAAEQADYERFVELGVAILQRTPNVPSRVISVVHTHQERLNGSGFPQHLRGDKIPLLGRAAAIVTYYDEITQPRGQSLPLSPSKAVAALYDGRDTLFHGDLVIEFIRAIGLYPTGTLVELNTGEVAVVVEQNFERRLKPHIMVVMDPHKRLLDEPIYLDMAADDKQKQVKIDAGKASPQTTEWIEIVHDLEPGAYSVDVLGICDQYVKRNTAKGLMGFLKGKRLGSVFGG
jgi:HD-GYP domain-containing protein (c-di-GMP phosphodiesterase class II)